jgi:hypothetical protein
MDPTLRQEIVTFLRNTPALGNNNFGENWPNSVLEQPQLHLSRMSRDFEYGD